MTADEAINILLTCPSATFITGRKEEAITSLIISYKMLVAERLAIQNESHAVTCVFCGYVYEPGTPTSNHESLKKHICECTEHPLRSALVELEGHRRIAGIIHEWLNNLHVPTHDEQHTELPMLSRVKKIIQSTASTKDAILRAFNIR